MNQKKKSPPSTAKRLLRTTAWTLACVAAVAAGAWTTHLLTPKPATWLMARVHDQVTAQTKVALAKHRPEQVRVDRDVVYRQSPTALAVDIYRPTARRTGLPPTVVWIHGGGMLSGRKDDVGYYAQVLAGRGFNVVTPDYTTATSKPYPTQLQDLNQALNFLVQQGDRLQLDRKRIFLAGDGAGAQLAAQLATAITSPTYARQLGLQPGMQPSQLTGVALVSGVLDFAQLRMQGIEGVAQRAVLWNYLGARDAAQTPGWEQTAVVRHVTARFPATFITAGSADANLPQSQALQTRLIDLAVPVTALFFDSQTEADVPAQYQFNLDNPAGRRALEATVGFLQTRAAIDPQQEAAPTAATEKAANRRRDRKSDAATASRNAR